MLLSLYPLTEKVRLEVVISGLCGAAESSGEEELRLKEGMWQSFKDDLADLLSTQDSVGLSAKAQSIMRQYACAFSDARFVSDVRPVFKRSLDEKSVALLVHTLKITYTEGEWGPP